MRVRDRSGALQFIQSAKGCLLRDLTAAYPEAEEDVRLLQAERSVYVLPAAEKDQKAIFPRRDEPPINISEDVFRLWHDIQVTAPVLLPISVSYDSWLSHSHGLPFELAEAFEEEA